MDTLQKLILATATMSPSELRDARQLVERAQAPDEVKEVVLRLIDLFISTGVDPQRRAQAAAACLLAIDEAESLINKSPSSSRSKPTSSNSGWVGGVVILAIIIVIWFFSRS